MANLRSVTTLVALTGIVLLSITGIIKYNQDNSSSDFNASLPVDVRGKVSALRRLSETVGLPQNTSNEDVCLNEGCLSASFGILIAMNAFIDPCKDFYQFSCGNWIRNNYPPPFAERWDWVEVNDERIRDIVIKILEKEENDEDPVPLNQARQLFMQCMDLKGVEENGVEPLKKAIEKIGGWQLLNPGTWNETSFDWMMALAKTYIETEQQTVLAIYNSVNPEDADKQIIHINQPFDQTAFTYSQEVLNNREKFSTTFAAYETYIIEVATALNSTQNQEQLRIAAKEIISFEEKLAKLSTMWEDRYKRNNLHSVYKLGEYQSKTDNLHKSFEISWSRLLKSYFQPEISDIDENENVIVLEEDYVEALISLLAEEKENGKHTLANYIVWRYVEASLDYSTEQMRAIRDKVTNPITRKAKCRLLTERTFGMAVSAKYIEDNFDEKSKEVMSEMVEDVKAAFEEIVNETTWMTTEVKKKAIEKKNAMSAKIAYPDWLKDKRKVEEFYSGAAVGDSFLESYHLLTAFTKKKFLGKLRTGTDKNYWVAPPPHIADAHAALELNMIVLHAGKLQPPFFDVGRPKHQNYGSIGYIIGHECSHLFDKIGARHDKTGNSLDWWDNDTQVEYEKRERCITEQYSKRCYDFKGGRTRCINGTLTQNENIADAGGVKLGFRAYKKYIEKNGEEPKIPGLERFSTEQLFFIGFANTHCEWRSSGALMRDLSEHRHSPNDWRVNGVVRNSIDFSAAFSCPVNSDGMNPPEKEKCIIW